MVGHNEPGTATRTKTSWSKSKLCAERYTEPLLETYMFSFFAETLYPFSGYRMWPKKWLHWALDGECSWKSQTLSSVCAGCFPLLFVPSASKTMNLRPSTLQNNHGCRQQILHCSCDKWWNPTMDGHDMRIQIWIPQVLTFKPELCGPGFFWMLRDR